MSSDPSASSEPNAVPPLHIKRPGPVVRVAARFSAGIASVTDQIGPYTRHWSEQNNEYLNADGPLLVAIGDSSALGIGASRPSNSYIGFLQRSLSERDGRTWRVINLAQSGARLADGVERQVPIAAGLPAAKLTICCLGSNDLTWSLNVTSMVRYGRELVEMLPAGSIVCGAAGRGAKADRVNRTLRETAIDRDLRWVNPWGEPGPETRQRLAEDRFHLNDLGYALLARPIARTIGTPEPPLPEADNA